MNDAEFATLDESVAKLLRQYKESPTIDNYVALRRKHPEIDCNINTTFGGEWLYAFDDELSKLGISPRLIARIVDVDIGAYDELSLLLLEKIIYRRNLAISGGTHLVSRGIAISDPMINYLIAIMLDSLCDSDEPEIPPALIVLIKQQFGTEDSNIKIEVKKKDSIKKAKLIAANMFINNEKPSYRKIAKILKVEPSTVMRWFPELKAKPNENKHREDNKFLETAEQWGSLIIEISKCYDSLSKKRDPRTKPEQE